MFPFWFDLEWRLNAEASYKKSQNMLEHIGFNWETILNSLSLISTCLNNWRLSYFKLVKWWYSDLWASTRGKHDTSTAVGGFPMISVLCRRERGGGEGDEVFHWELQQLCGVQVTSWNRRWQPHIFLVTAMARTENRGVISIPGFVCGRAVIDM